jgi:membrane associated rhomboid family serine protease
LEPLFFNIFPNYGGPPGQTALPVGNPFGSYIWYAVVGLILGVLAAIPYHRQQTTQSRLTGEKQ